MNIRMYHHYHGAYHYRLSLSSSSPSSPRLLFLHILTIIVQSCLIGSFYLSLFRLTPAQETGKKRLFTCRGQHWHSGGSGLGRTRFGSKKWRIQRGIPVITGNYRYTHENCNCPPFTMEFLMYTANICK